MSNSYKGVTPFPLNKNKPWRAQVVVPNGDKSSRCVSLGYFETEEDAARAYDNAVYHLAKDGYRTRNIELNFSDEYSGANPPACSDATLKMLLNIMARKPRQRPATLQREVDSILAQLRELGKKASQLIDSLQQPEAKS